MDNLHGIEIEQIDLALALEMIKFIMHLGKSKWFIDTMWNNSIQNNIENIEKVLNNLFAFDETELYTEN